MPTEQEVAESDIVERQFALFDQDNSGLLDRGELKRVLQKLDPSWTDAACNELLETLDTNEDGKISYTEFVSFIFQSTEDGEAASLLTKEEEALAKKKLDVEEKKKAAAKGAAEKAAQEEQADDSKQAEAKPEADWQKPDEAEGKVEAKEEEGVCSTLRAKENSKSDTIWLPPGAQVRSAFYGAPPFYKETKWNKGADVTAKVKELASSGETIKACSKLLGDPVPGREKILFVDIFIPKQVKEPEHAEQEALRLADEASKKAGNGIALGASVRWTAEINPELVKEGRIRFTNECIGIVAAITPDGKRVLVQFPKQEMSCLVDSVAVVATPEEGEVREASVAEIQGDHMITYVQGQTAKDGKDIKMWLERICSQPEPTTPEGEIPDKIVDAIRKADGPLSSKREKEIRESVQAHLVEKRHDRMAKEEARLRELKKEGKLVVQPADFERLTATEESEIEQEIGFHKSMEAENRRDVSQAAQDAMRAQLRKEMIQKKEAAAKDLGDGNEHAAPVKIHVKSPEGEALMEPFDGPVLSAKEALKGLEGFADGADWTIKVNGKKHSKWPEEDIPIGYAMEGASGVVVIVAEGKL